STINIALSHYDHNGANPDHRMRSLLYKGCVMEELGDAEQAIEYYKRAETLCPADDYFHIGYINFRKALLYQNAYADSIPTGCYNKAIQAFRAIGNKHYEGQALNSFGALYFYSNPDSALLMVNQSISLAQEINDSVGIVDGYNSIIAILYRKKAYREITELVKQQLIPLSDGSDRMIYDIISISFSKQGELDAARNVLQTAPDACTIEDTISQLRALSEIELASGDTQQYILHNSIAVDKSDSLMFASQADKIREAEAKYDMAQKEVENLTIQRQYIFVIAILSIVIIIVSFCVYFYRRREKYARIELEDAISQVTASRQQLEQVLYENQNHVNELKAQEEQLHKMQSLMGQAHDTHNDDLAHIEEQLSKTNKALDAAEVSTKIQDQTLVCLDEILRAVFYSGRYNSDQIIDNDSVLNMKPEFWNELYNLVSLKHNDIFARIEAKGIVLNENEKRLIALSVANLPRAIIRRILGLKNIQVVSNRRQKLAKKITGGNSSFDEIFR
ncbi:MAG: hypothetical protein KBT27_04140, partial [Prevotellaceae bacterium]|nr:hypothetical protein [Candidatus Faecinaster equi]